MGPLEQCTWSAFLDPAGPVSYRYANDERRACKSIEHEGMRRVGAMETRG